MWNGLPLAANINVSLFSYVLVPGPIVYIFHNVVHDTGVGNKILHYVAVPQY